MAHIYRVSVQHCPENFFVDGVIILGHANHHYFILHLHQKLFVNTQKKPHEGESEQAPGLYFWRNIGNLDPLNVAIPVHYPQMPRYVVVFHLIPVYDQIDLRDLLSEFHGPAPESEVDWQVHQKKLWLHACDQIFAHLRVPLEKQSEIHSHLQVLEAHRHPFVRVVVVVEIPVNCQELLVLI